MLRKIAISAVSALTLLTGTAWAEEGTEVTDVAFSFEGPFGTFDTHQLQRGLQVFTEVCSACHGLKFLRIGALAITDRSGAPAAVLTGKWSAGVAGRSSPVSASVTVIALA